jgi:hypothetical protein
MGVQVQPESARGFYTNWAGDADGAADPRQMGRISGPDKGLGARAQASRAPDLVRRVAEDRFGPALHDGQCRRGPGPDRFGILGEAGLLQLGLIGSCRAA